MMNRFDVLNRKSVWAMSIIFVVCSGWRISKDERASPAQSYYFKTTGDDNADGTKEHPWQTLKKLNTLDLEPGDTVYLEGGDTFTGPLVLDSADSGDESQNVVIRSTGNGSAIVHGGNGMAMHLRGVQHMVTEDLHIKGNGRKEGNTASGLVVEDQSQYVSIENVDVEGFQKSGLWIYSSSEIWIDRVYAHANGAAGIAVSGNDKKTDCRNITIRNSKAENNPGDPTNFTNHSGNGIVVGYVSNVLIEYCTATNNGWDMPRIGNGPVGIWAYEADSVTIQHCISYRNKTSKGGEDGGGFDLDGGVTNSIIQYCLSYENEGSGFGLFQYSGASPWNNNIIRFNISENDGLVSAAHAGIYIWNGSDDAIQFTRGYVYNNVITNASGAAIHFATKSNRDAFFYYNNILIGKREILKGVSQNEVFLGNLWWSLSGGFQVNDIKNFATWAKVSGQEMKDGKLRGFNVRPNFEGAGQTMIDSPEALTSFKKYKPSASSPWRTQGIDLSSRPGDGNGGKDFNQQPAPANGIGASF
jgi:hypothetical protein